MKKKIKIVVKPPKPRMKLPPPSKIHKDKRVKDRNDWKLEFRRRGLSDFMASLY